VAAKVDILEYSPEIADVLWRQSGRAGRKGRSAGTKPIMIF